MHGLSSIVLYYFYTYVEGPVKIKIAISNVKYFDKYKTFKSHPREKRNRIVLPHNIGLGRV